MRGWRAAVVGSTRSAPAAAGSLRQSRETPFPPGRRPWSTLCPCSSPQPSASFTPGANALGILTSNGVDLQVGSL